MPSASDSGTAITAAKPARNSVFLSRGAIERDDGPRMAAAEAARAREGIAEIALEHAADPEEVALDRRAIEADLTLEGRDRLGRRRLTEDGGREIARQHGDRREDHDRDDEQA